jgi:GNAT superfamily N-acetyltransferase
MYAEERYSSLEEYMKKLDGKKPTIFIARDSDTGIIAGDSISFSRDDAYYIWIMGVLPEHHGRGIGTHLLSRNEVAAASEGFKAMTAKVYDVSTQMRYLLQKSGYRVTLADLSVGESKQRVSYYRFDLSNQVA